MAPRATSSTSTTPILLLGGDLPAHVVGVRLAVDVRLVEWLIGTGGEAHRARGAGVEDLLHARARRRLEHVARALDARPDDVALGVARPHEEARRRVVEARAALVAPRRRARVHD